MIAYSLCDDYQYWNGSLSAGISSTKIATLTARLITASRIRPWLSEPRNCTIYSQAKTSFSSVRQDKNCSTILTILSTKECIKMKLLLGNSVSPPKNHKPRALIKPGHLDHQIKSDYRSFSTSDILTKENKHSWHRPSEAVKYVHLTALPFTFMPLSC